jgi:hypothetical protein
MANRDLVLPRFAQHFAKDFHNALLFTLQPKLKNESILTENNGFRGQNDCCVKQG